MLAGNSGSRAAAVVVCCVTLLCGFCATGAAAARWQPPQQLTWYWQLTGTPQVEPVQATDIDGFDNSAATVASFHARGQRVICYIDVGTAENWRPDYGRFPASVLGASNGWPGEKWLDIRQLSVLEPIMTARFQMCAQKGFDAVEPDNIDGYQNGSGFPLTASDQLAYNEWVANEVHSLGMAVFQKNDPDQAAQLQPYFDGVIDEQCNQYTECDSFRPYLAAGKPVLNAEYQSSLYPGFCSADARAGIMGALYSINLDGSVYKPCFGPSSTTPVVGGGPSPPGGSSGRGGRALDRVAPRVRIGHGLLVVHRGAVRVVLRCPAGQSYCAGVLRVSTVVGARAHSGRRHARASLVGQARFRVSGGRRAVVRVSLHPAAMHRLGRRGSVRVLVTVRARDGAGRAGTSRRITQLARTSR